MPLLLAFLLGAVSLWPQELDTGSFRPDPQGLTPLSALFTTRSTNSAPITVRVRGKIAALDIAHTYPAGFGTEFPIHGMYAGMSNIVQVEQGGKVRNFRVFTKALPQKANIQTKVLMDQLEAPDPFNQDLFFVNVISQRSLMAFDRAGDIRYVLNKDIYYYVHTLLEGGNIIVHNTEKAGDYVKMTLLGREVQRIKGARFHHDSARRGQNYLIPSMSRWGWEDTVTEVNPEGRIVAVRYLGEALRRAASPADEPLLKKMIFDNLNIARRAGTNTRADWAHINGLAYDAATDTLILSTRHQGLMALRWSSWELLWWLSDSTLMVERGYGYAKLPEDAKLILDIPSLQKYRLSIAKGQGPKNQHAPVLRANGNIVVFDNSGDIRKSVAGSHVREYKISKGKAELVRSFLHPKKHYSRLSSDVDLVGQNHENWLILYAEAYPNHLSVVAPDGTILYDLSFITKQLFYRADKMPLYPYRDAGRRYSVDQNEALGL